MLPLLQLYKTQTTYISSINAIAEKSVCHPRGDPGFSSLPVHINTMMYTLATCHIHRPLTPLPFWTQTCSCMQTSLKGGRKVVGVKLSKPHWLWFSECCLCWWPKTVFKTWLLSQNSRYINLAIVFRKVYVFVEWQWNGCWHIKQLETKRSS